MKKIIIGATALFMSGSALALGSPILTNPELQRAIVEAGPVPAGGALAEAGAPNDEWTGMGGPEEEAVWPACKPGPGDDRCIQFYERDVKPSFLKWMARGSETGMGGPDAMADAKQKMPASAMASNPILAPKDPSLPRMETSQVHAADAGDKPVHMVMQHPHVDHAAMDHGMTAEEMRTNSAWAVAGGKETHTGVGGPEENEEPPVYPRCRSRSDDRCQQGS